MQKTPIDQVVLPDLLTVFAYSLMALEIEIPASTNNPFVFNNPQVSVSNVPILSDEAFVS